MDKYGFSPLVNDDILLDVAKAIEEDESRTSVVNMERIKELVDAYNEAKKLVSGTGARVTYKINQPFTSMGSVSITGKAIELQKPSRFANVGRFASNLEVYPKTDGTICMTFTFHGLTTPLE